MTAKTLDIYWKSLAATNSEYNDFKQTSQVQMEAWGWILIKNHPGPPGGTEVIADIKG